MKKTFVLGFSIVAALLTSCCLPFSGDENDMPEMVTLADLQGSFYGERLVTLMSETELECTSIFIQDSLHQTVIQRFKLHDDGSRTLREQFSQSYGGAVGVVTEPTPLGIFIHNMYMENPYGLGYYHYGVDDEGRFIAQRILVDGDYVIQKQYTPNGWKQCAK